MFGKQAIREQLRIDELLEGMLKEHEDQIGKKDTQDFMDILLKVYQEGKAEVKMTRNNIKAFLTVKFFFFFRPSINGWFPFLVYRNNKLKVKKILLGRAFT